MTATVAGIHLSGNHAGRPAANTVPDGSLYSCSTHGLIYQSNFAGNSWATWATLGSGTLSDTGVITYLDATVAAAPSTPASGKLRIYAKTGKVLAVKDDSGAETILGAAGGGSTTDPVIEAFGAATTTYDGSTLAAFTSYGSPDTADANSTVPNHFFFKDTQSSSWQFCGKYIALPHAAPFTMIARLEDVISRGQYNYAGIFLGDSTPSKIMTLAHKYDLGTVNRSIGGYVAANLTDSSGSGAYNDTTIGQVAPPLWLAMVENSTTSVDLYYSLNGRIWYKLAAAQNPSMTIATLGFVINAGYTGAGTRSVAAAFKWMGIWNSALTFPGI